jgi:hypothetical protein
MAKLNRELEEEEAFIADYIEQMHMMNSMTDLQIKVLLKRMMVEDPEWFDLLRGRFRRKQMKEVMRLAKEVNTDVHGSIRELARKVA